MCSPYNSARIDIKQWKTHSSSQQNFIFQPIECKINIPDKNVEHISMPSTYLSVVQVSRVALRYPYLYTDSLSKLFIFIYCLLAGSVVWYLSSVTALFTMRLSDTFSRFSVLRWKNNVKPLQSKRFVTNVCCTSVRVTIPPQLFWSCTISNNVPMCLVHAIYNAS